MWNDENNPQFASNHFSIQMKPIILKAIESNSKKEMVELQNAYDHEKMLLSYSKMR